MKVFVVVFTKGLAMPPKDTIKKMEYPLQSTRMHLHDEHVSRLSYYFIGTLGDFARSLAATLSGQCRSSRDWICYSFTCYLQYAKKKLCTFTIIVAACTQTINFWLKCVLYVSVVKYGD